ncbi:MAG TPA: FUSC family membrane protein, partial [Candidatus Tumulicola sp.]
MKLVQSARSILRSIVAFDRSTLEYGFALRCTVGVAIPLIAACAFGHPRAGFAPAVGALIGGFTSLQGIYRSRVIVVFGVTLGIAISSFLGALAAPSLPALILLTLVVGYAYGTIAQFGMPAGVAALNTTVAFVIFSSLPLTPQQDLDQSSLLFLGGMLQAVLLMLAWPLDRSAIERRGLAKAYRDLAGYAASLTTLATHAPPIAALATARQIVADQQPLARSRDVARYKRILADAEALRHRLGALAILDSADSTSTVVADLARATGEQLFALAATLDGRVTKAHLEEVRTRTRVAFVAFEHAFEDDAFALALVRDIA